MNEPTTEDILNNIIIDENECWIWQGAKQQRGYGVICRGQGKQNNRKTFYAHRVMYFASGRKLEPDEEVAHTCNNASCCNPDHLIAFSRHENMHHLRLCNPNISPTLTIHQVRVARHLRELGHTAREIHDILVREYDIKCSMRSVQRAILPPSSPTRSYKWLK